METHVSKKKRIGWTLIVICKQKKTKKKQKHRKLRKPTVENSKGHTLFVVWTS